MCKAFENTIYGHKYFWHTYSKNEISSRIFLDFELLYYPNPRCKGQLPITIFSKKECLILLTPLDMTLTNSIEVQQRNYISSRYG